MTPKLFISTWYFPHSPWGSKGGRRGPWEAHRPSVGLRPGRTGPHGPHAAISCRFTQVAHGCTCPASSGALRRPGSVAPSSWLQALRQAPHKEARQPPCCPPPARQGPTSEAVSQQSLILGGDSHARVCGPQMVWGWRGFPGGLLRLDPAFAYVEPSSS